jgi:hypothetical protein
VRRRTLQSKTTVAANVKADALRVWETPMGRALVQGQGAVTLNQVS